MKDGGALRSSVLLSPFEHAITGYFSLGYIQSVLSCTLVGCPLWTVGKSYDCIWWQISIVHDLSLDAMWLQVLLYDPPAGQLSILGDDMNERILLEFCSAQATRALQERQPITHQLPLQ